MVYDDGDGNQPEKEDIIKAYFYGKDLVKIDKVNEEILNFKDDKCLKMLGFADENKVP